MAKLISFLFTRRSGGRFSDVPGPDPRTGPGDRHSRRPYHPRQVRDPERQPGQRHASASTHPPGDQRGGRRKASDHAVLIASSRQHIEGMADVPERPEPGGAGAFPGSAEAVPQGDAQTQDLHARHPGIAGAALPAAGRRPEPDGRTGGLDRGRRARRRDQSQLCRHPGDHGHDRHHQGQRPEAARILDGISKSFHRTPLAETLEDLAEFMLDRQRIDEARGRAARQLRALQVDPAPDRGNLCRDAGKGVRRSRAVPGLSGASRP